MTTEIAIVGAACRYPDARSPDELWHNALAGRRAFRAIPEARLRIADYAARFAGDPDSTYVRSAALIEDFELDRDRFKIAAATARVTDIVHWLALDVADRALRNAGFPSGDGLPRSSTTVIVGNSLTGEMSRASALRLRWPYVARVLEPVLSRAGGGPAAVAAQLEAIERSFKHPLPPPDDDSLAGGLSNTIAGRICNAFDLGGGGFTVDAACSSSLLAVAQACSALAAGDAEIVIAGGVDVSLDPFELVGFARLGALAHDVMRVYDRHPTGFLPGEGAGFVVLARRADAEARGLEVHAVVRGWGIASDGIGGITRPDPAGHRRAIARCYARAPFGLDSVALFEGHGTGTAVGDDIELAAIAGALREAGRQRPAAIGSIKALIGHTKAAAGIAGLLKATAAVRDRLVPPTYGIEEPHAELTRPGAVLRAPVEIEPWPEDGPARAGVSSIGFGGINVHVVVEGASPPPQRARELHRLQHASQDAELLVVSAADPRALAAAAQSLAMRVAGASLAELSDLACALASETEHRGARATVVAASADEARDALDEIAQTARNDLPLFDAARGRYYTVRPRRPRIALLFTGQAAPVPLDGGALARRFPAAARLWRCVPRPVGDRLDTRNAQPAIVAASLGAAAALAQLGVTGDLAIGHSLGELSALAWAESWSAEDAIAIAAARGHAMSSAGDVPSAMAGLTASVAEATALIAGTPVVIAACNGPTQTVVSGERSEIDAVLRRAAGRGIATTLLTTSHAFHSPLMAAAAPALRRTLEATPPRPPARPILSTVTADLLAGEVSEILVDQLTSPVLFSDALRRARDVDLFLELGPGRVLTGMVAGNGAPAVAIDACGRSLRGLLSALGAAWTLGALVDLAALFADRGCKPVDLSRSPRLFGNPCEAAPGAAITHQTARDAPERDVAPQPPSGDALGAPASSDVLSTVRRAVAAATELPLASISDDARLLEDLHLSSISIGQIVTRVARELGSPAPRPLAGWARATLAEIAAAFQDKSRPYQPSPAASPPAASWVRTFATVEIAASPPSAPRTGCGPWRWFGARARGLSADVLDGTAGGTAIIVADSDLTALIDGARADGPYLVIDPGRIADGFARTLHLETGQPVTVVSFDDAVEPSTAAAIRAEAAGLSDGFRAVHVTREGALTTPVLAASPVADSDLALDDHDVVVVTGGGKGIAAECALALARRTGCRLITIGRHAPCDDAALAANLERFAAYGVRAFHAVADVTDGAVLRAGLASAIEQLGPITAIVHAAAINEPCAIRELTPTEFARTIAPKVAGLHHVLACVDRARLRAVVSFGSIIARTGLPGEAHYALANELLRRATLELSRELPACRCAVLEWSAWAEVGMAERIGRLDALLQRGLTPIVIDDGVRLFLRCFGARGAIAITGRLGDAGIVAFHPPALPLLRFVERPLVHVPEVELVSEVELSPNIDRYLDDHVIEGARVMPAVLQIEAAHQVVAALAPPPVRWRIARVVFPRAIVVDDEGTRIRIAACLLDDGCAEIVITAALDGHRAECMRMTLAPDAEPPGARSAAAGECARIPPPYGELLPQRGRFARVTGYEHLETRCCRFRVRTAGDANPWFAHHTSAALCLPNPGVRDALLHGMQVAVPHHRLVPIAARGVRLAAHWPAGEIAVEARELDRKDGEYTWTLVARDADGVELERWSEVVFRSLGERRAIPAVALRPWLERCLDELTPGLRISWLDPAAHPGDARPGVVRRPDHRPEIRGAGISMSNGAGLRLAVTGPGNVACDLEAIDSRPAEIWRDLLGVNLELAAEIAQCVREPFDHAATRVWTALECAAKLGDPAPHLLLVRTAGSAALLRVGTIEVTTLIMQVIGHRGIAVAVATAAVSQTAGIEAAS